ncbi:MAG: hypothetical protein M3464_12010 [Chloroflexota bacterium]|nr:hypothetical protein [Chloroflexota bacterium]
MELYPGYPQYRGYIAGLTGSGGDRACLEELELAHPRFDRAVEDQANRQAAMELNLAGDVADWTWENWMLIESVRGLLPTTCYFCAMVEARTEEGPRQAATDWDDPRVIVGSLGSTATIGMLLAESDVPGWAFDSLLKDDHDLRVLVGIMRTGSRNASEVLADYQLLVSELADGLWLDFDTVLAALVEQGGYEPTPPTAPPEDQLFTIMSAVPVLSRLLTPFASEAFVRTCDAISSMWSNRVMRDPTTAPPFVDWFRTELEERGMLPR